MSSCLIDTEGGHAMEDGVADVSLADLDSVADDTMLFERTSTLPPCYEQTNENPQLRDMCGSDIEGNPSSNKASGS